MDTPGVPGSHTTTTTTAADTGDPTDSTGHRGSLLAGASEALIKSVIDLGDVRRGL